MEYSEEDRRCVACGETEEIARLEQCVICRKYFCADCAYRSAGRRFCGTECAKIYFYSEETDDDDPKQVDSD